jgi:6-methylsalicylate decarboxylase
MRIDVHAHYFPPEYTACLQRLGDPRAESRDAVPGGPPTLAEQAAMLDAVGIDLQVLSISLLQPYLPRETDAVAAARLANDIYADATRGHAGRFAAFGCVPLPHVDAALAEAERCLDRLGMRGITVGCSVAGQSLDDAAFAPFFAELDRRAAVVFLHPVGQGLVPERDPHGLAWMVGAPFEDTVAALQLVMSGLTIRYPNVKVIVPHLGGTLPFLLGRIEGALGRRRARGGPPIPFEGDAGPLLRHPLVRHRERPPRRPPLRLRVLRRRPAPPRHGLPLHARRPAPIPPRRAPRDRPVGGRNRRPPRRHRPNPAQHPPR